MTGVLEAFADEIGSSDPVVPVGGRTQWDVGGSPDVAAREVVAPAGIVAYEPGDLTIRVRAGTRVADLQAALAERGQMIPLDPRDPEHATVGGVLAVGHSGVRRLRYGPVRDTLLEARFVSAEGRLIKAGGPTVKNVSGFDVCRLLVGSLGTLGIIAEVVLRVQPRPIASRWIAGRADPFEARRRLLRPSVILWDGTTTWVLLEGHPGDIDADTSSLPDGFEEVGGPPPIQSVGRRSVRPSEIRALTGTFVAEVGVGTVHLTEPPPKQTPDPSTTELHVQIKETFDPTGRLNPGRSVT